MACLRTKSLSEQEEFGRELTLKHSFLALAASSGSVAKGVLIMMCFGLGTIPVMLVTGAGLSLATTGIRRKLIRVAAVIVQFAVCDVVNSNATSIGEC